MPSWFIGGVQNVGKMQMLEKWSPLLKELLLIILLHLNNRQA